jgi:hypothetical protein
MSTATTSPSSLSSLQLKARIAGGLYLFTVLTAALGEGYLHGRLAYAVGLIAVAGMVAVTILVYIILRPVDKNLVFLATTINLVGCLFEAGRFSPQGVDIAVVMTGFYCLLVAIVLLRATFLPRLLVLAYGDRRPWLAELHVAVAGQPALPLEPGLRPDRGGRILPLAPPQGNRHPALATAERRPLTPATPIAPVAKTSRTLRSSLPVLPLRNFAPFANPASRLLSLQFFPSIASRPKSCQAPSHPQNHPNPLIRKDLINIKKLSYN